MSLIDVLRGVHIGAGTVALATFGIPMIAAKGGRIHRTAGWVFVVAVGIISVTALATCVYRLGFHPDPRSRVVAPFLSYAAILSGTSASIGVRALRTRKRTTAQWHFWDVGLPIALVVSAVAIAIYGWRIGRPLLVGFAPVGLIVGGLQLRYWLRPPQEKMHWWFEHMGGMIGASVATLTAFLVVNAPRFGFTASNLGLWLGPAVLGQVGLALWTRKYRRQFAGVPASRRAAA
jgi:hypothetical protein